jgi:hypothetical protein
VTIKSPPEAQAIVNTILALLTSTVTSFGLTQILQDGRHGPFDAPMTRQNGPNVRKTI